MKTSHRVMDGINYTIVLVLVGFTVCVFLWVFTSSLKSTPEIMKGGFGLPVNALREAARNYGRAWTVAHMSAYFGNSVVVVAASIILLLCLSAPAAYVLARIPFRGAVFVTFYFVAGMSVPLQLILVPYYVLLSKFRLTNTLLGLVLTYATIQLPLSIVLLSAFFRTLPTELEDAAAIDGCTDFRLFLRVMVPLAAPGIVTAAILNFVWIWKDFLMAFLLIDNDKKRTMALGLLNVNYSMQYTGDWASMFAALVIMIVPVAVVYLALTKHVTAGLTLGIGK